MSAGRALTGAGTALATAGAVHAVVNSSLLRRPSLPPPRCGRRVSVLLPVRNEQHRVAHALTSVLAQRGVPELEVIVLDDGSTDRTAEVAAWAAGCDPRVRIVSGSPPGADWLGKPHACAQLAELATGEVLAFVDADVVLAPDAVAATVALLDEHGLDLASPYPRQLADGPLPRLIQPLLQWSWLTFLPLRLAERSARPALTAANGQFLAVRTEAYRRCGGHAAVRADVLDDLALARAVKRAGGRVAVVDGTPLARCRMYDDGRSLSDGYAKSLWAAFGSPVGAGTVCAGLLCAYVLPPLAALRGSRVGLAGYAAGVAGRVVAARRTGGRWWPDPLAHPLSVLAFCSLVARSLLGRRRGRLSWKGRPVG